MVRLHGSGLRLTLVGSAGSPMIAPGSFFTAENSTGFRFFVPLRPTKKSGELKNGEGISPGYFAASSAASIRRVAERSTSMRA